MEIIGIGDVEKGDAGEIIKKILVVEMTEAELDMITGVAGKPHISNRYRPGHEVNVAAMYHKVQNINEKHAEIKKAAQDVIAAAGNIAAAIPL